MNGDLPFWPDPWRRFADWPDLALALFALALIVLMIIWWRQQTRNWFRIAMTTFLVALILGIGSTYVFQVPPHEAGCVGTCPGWAGYPLPVALLRADGSTAIAPLDFLLNLVLIWLFTLGAALTSSIVAYGLQWWRRSIRWRLLFILAVVVLPWALLPRIINPPQPAITGEELRLANNARRIAEFTYRISGTWVLRLATEDVRFIAATPTDASDILGDGQEAANTAYSEVCLRGYTYFYLPWRRYRIALDSSGATALGLTERPLDGSCWTD